MKTILLTPVKLYQFLNQVYLELKKVDWLSRKKTVRYSLLVVISIIISLIFLILVDKAFALVRGYLL